MRASGLLLASILLVAGQARAAAFAVEVLVPGGVMHAVEGISFDGSGMLLGTSIHGQAVYRIDPRTGVVEILVPTPHGESDDVAVGPAGTAAAGIVAWTAQRTGEIRMQRPGGRPEVLMRDVPRVNPIAFSADGRLFTAQLGADGDALWELDPVGGGAPRLVARHKGRLNGFGFGPDGRLYAPLFGTDRLVAIDVDSGEYSVVASGVGAPAAAKVDARGDVLSVDYLSGELWRTDLRAGTSRVIARVREPIDSLAIAADGTIYLSNVSDSSIFAIDPVTGASRTVVDGRFSMPLGMSLVQVDGEPRILVADPFGYRYVDPRSGAVNRPPWEANRGGSTAVTADAESIALTNAGYGLVRRIDRRTGEVVAETKAIRAPRGIALARNGDLIVADAAAARLVRVTREGVLDIATGLEHPVGLLLEGDSSAIVSEYRRGSLRRVDLATGRHVEIVTGLHHPAGVARMKDGRLAIVEPELRRVLAVDPRTGARTVLANGLALSLEGLDLPRDTNAGIVVDSDGAIYVSCPGDNSIIRIAARGDTEPGEYVK